MTVIEPPRYEVGLASAPLVTRYSEDSRPRWQLGAAAL